MFIRMNRLLVLVICSGLIGGCQMVTDQAMVLDPTFSRAATEFRLQKPTWTIKDDAYHQSFGGFQINELDLSGKSLRQQQTSSDFVLGDAGDLAFQFLFHDVVNLDPQWVNTYNVTGEQDFEFNVQMPAQSVVHSNCKMLYQGQAEETTDNDVNSYNWQRNTELMSFLGCVVTQNGEISELIVERKNGLAPKFKLHRGKTQLRIDPVETALFQTNERWTPTPMLDGHVFGYNFFIDNQQVAAVTIDSQFPKIWILNEQTPAQQQWLVAVAYSIMMFNWQDDWQRSGGR